MCINVCTLFTCVCRTRTRRRAATRRQPVARRATQQRPVITAHTSSSGNDDDDDDYSANEHSSSANSSDADYRRRTKWLTKRMAAQAVRSVSQDMQYCQIFIRHSIRLSLVYNFLFVVSISGSFLLLRFKIVLLQLFFTFGLAVLS